MTAALTKRTARWPEAARGGHQGEKAADAGEQQEEVVTNCISIGEREREPPCN